MRARSLFTILYETATHPEDDAVLLFSDAQKQQHSKSELINAPPAVLIHYIVVE